MKKENFVIGLIAVFAVAFFLGRLSVSTKDNAKTANKDETAAAKAGASATGASAADTAKPADTAAKAANPIAPTAANKGAGLGALPKAKPPAAAVAGKKPRAIPKARGQMSVVESPYKGPAVAKVTIMEVSDFQ